MNRGTHVLIDKKTGHSKAVDAPHIDVHWSLKKRFYLLIHERQRKRQRPRQRDKQAPCREPSVGLHPRTPGQGLSRRQMLNQ